MSNKDLINELFSGVEIPKKLEPENIAKMLRAEASRAKASSVHEIDNTDRERSFEYTKITAPLILDDISADENKEKEKQEQKKQKRNFSVGIKTSPNTMLARITITIAACIVLVIGVSLFNGHNQDQLKTDRSVSTATPAEDYNSIYNAVSRFNIENSATEVTIEDNEADYSSADINGAPDTMYRSYAAYPWDVNNALDVSSGATSAVAYGDVVYGVSVSSNTLYAVEYATSQKPFFTIEGKNNKYYHELYTRGNYLYAVGYYYTNEVEEIEYNGEVSEYEYSLPYTFVEIYDISGEINLENTFTQSGYYLGTTFFDDNIVISTSFEDCNPTPLKSVDQTERYIPSISFDDEVQYLQPEQICVPDTLYSSAYGVVSVLSKNEAWEANSEAILGYPHQIAFDDENIIFTSGDQSSVARFDGNGFDVVNITDNVNAAAITPDNKLAVVTYGNKLLIDGIEVADISMFSKGNAPCVLACADNSLYIFIYDDLNIWLKYNLDTGEFGECDINDAVFYNFSESGVGCALYESESNSYLTLKVRLEAQNAVIIEEEISSGFNEGIYSNALCNRGSLNVDNNTCYVPIEYWDGIDYVTQYRKYEIGETISEVGHIEYHVVDNSSCFSNGLLYNGSLIAISDNAIAVIDAETMKEINSISITESGASYSNHMQDAE